MVIPWVIRVATQIVLARRLMLDYFRTDVSKDEFLMTFVLQFIFSEPLSSNGYIT
jgi:hypothetical protein